MADATSRQALATTFAFGMVVSAAVGTAALHGTSGPSSLFRDGTRLVLVIFLICSSLWAATAFIATLVDPTAASACQAAVAVASGFDQVARIMLEEFLFWSMKSDVRATFGVLFPQAVIVLRFILGGIFVGIQRPQFNPVCVGTTLLIVLGVAVLAADVFIILMLCIRASSVGIFRDVSERTEARDRSKALIVVTLSLAVWTASSVPMTLGMPSLDLVVRTVLAAAGVLFVIAFVAFFGTNLTSKTEANVPRRPQISRPEYIPSRPLTTADTRVQDFPAKDDVDRSLVGTRQAPAARQSTRPMRSSRQVKDTGGLPTISRPSPGQAEAGVGGLPVAGVLFPPVRAQTAPVLSATPQPRQAKKTGIKGGKPSISRPVLTAQSEQGPLKKITMVDLATAAKNEQERREYVGSSRPVDQAKALSPEELRNRPQSFKRKEVGPAVALSANPPLQAVSATSSAQLPSPGQDELRRRSPRQSRQTPWAGLTPVVPQRATHYQDGAASSGVSAASPPELPPRSPLRPRTAQSMQRPADARADTSSVKVMSAVDKEPLTRQTAQPGTVRGQMRPERPAPSPPRDSVERLVPQVPPLSPRVSPQQALERSGSQRVAHRQLADLSRNGSVKLNIRPSRQRPSSPKRDLPPKTPVQLRQVNGIPSNPRAGATKTPVGEVNKPQHQTGVFANGTRRDVGGPTRAAMDRALSDILKRRPVADHSSPISVVHRPRPIPRKSRYSPSSRGSARLNHSPMPSFAYSSPGTASFPHSAGLLESKSQREQGSASQAAQVQLSSRDLRSRKRRSSSLPDIKGLPFKLFPASAAESLPPTPANNAAQRPLVPNGSISKLPGIRSRQSASKFVSKFSVDTVISPFEERQSEAYDTITEDPASGDGTKRRSSMVLPGESEASPTSPKSEGSIKGSSFPNFPASVDKSGLLKPETAATLSKSPAWLGPAGFVDSAILTDDEDGRETVTFMLDQSAVPQEQYGQASNQDERSRASWHRRVGDECPTFSDRKSMGQIRIVTPPPPLLLNQPMRPRRQPAADPVILESPQEALDQIQQQLRKLEDPDEESAANEQQRLSLLANLEQEMGLQESRWQQMRDDFKRVSVSTAISSPSTAGAASRLVSLDVSPMANVVAASSGPSSPFAGTMSPMAAEDHDLFSPDAAATAVAGQVHIIRPAVPPQALPAPRPSDEPLHNDTTLSVQRQVDSRSHGAGSPSSSVSADGTDDERAPDGIPKERYPGFVLCNPASPPVGIKMDTDKQGVAPTLAAPQSPQSQPELERPVTRRSPQASGVSGSPVGNSAPMITRNAASNRSTVSAPSPAVRQRPQQPASRPRTMRPPRRPKRISTLPDIVEDPQPLKGKRETLGLFQFPWGERSDVATIPLTFSMPPGAVAPTIRSGAAPMYPSLENQIRTLGSQKYPASFFEDYDDYDEDDDDVSLDSSDDDFDEATLWEIASLLKSDKVPSRGSLFPGQEEERFESASIVDDYLDGEAFIEDEEELDYEPTSASLARGPSSPTIPGGSTLWVDGRDSSSEARAHGLPQPEPTSWEGYVAATEGRRVASRKIDPSNTNGEVWSATLPTLKDTASSSSSRLWTHPRPAPSPRTTSSRVITPSEIEKGSHDRDSVPSNRPATANFLWSQPEPAIKEPRGLPQSDLHIWANYPVSENTLCRAKTPAANPKARETRELWNTKSAIISPSEASGLYASFASTGRDNTMWLPSPGAAKSSALDRNSINASTNTVSQPHLTSGSPMATSEETTETLEDCPSIAECAKASPDPRPRLWSPPQPIEPVLRGLARPDREVWESYLVPEQLERKIRSPEPLPSIKSSSLWAPRQEQGNCVASRGLLHSSVTDTTQSNAMNASVVAPTFPSTSVPRDIRDAASTGGTESSHLSAEFKTGLWRPTAVVTEEPQGLFQVGHSVAYDRNAKPAAQVTRPSRRTEQRPLAAVEATGLWTASPSRHSFTHDWVSLSSVRPNTPGGTSSYSGSESPRSDASSAYSSVTGMSTVNSVAAVCQPTNAEEATPSTNRPTEGRKELSLVPEFVSEVQWQADATAARKEVVDGFTQVPLLAEFVSETQWQADVAVARKKKVEEGFTQVPLLAEFVSETQWQATLKDANQAGEVDADTAEDALARAAHDPATPAVWAEALRDALGASSLIEGPARALGPPPSAQVQVQAQAPPPVVKASGFDVARHHPVFAVSVLDTSSGGDVHPAAWGYLNTSINGDPDSMVR